MERLSTFAILGIPDGLAIALVLILLSLSVAPWLGGAEIGPLKVPKLASKPGWGFRIVVPLLLGLAIGGFAPIWPTSEKPHTALTHDQYIETFYTWAGSGQADTRYVHGELYVLNELETRELARIFGGTIWSGGDHWGQVTFEANGRNATYANEGGRSPGRILIQGVPPGTVPAILAEWIQEDGQQGRMIFFLQPGAKDELKIVWGPNFTVEGQWVLKNSSARTSDH